VPENEQKNSQSELMQILARKVSFADHKKFAKNSQISREKKARKIFHS
jgi:hypothetical protein